MWKKAQKSGGWICSATQMTNDSTQTVFSSHKKSRRPLLSQNTALNTKRFNYLQYTNKHMTCAPLTMTTTLKSKHLIKFIKKTSDISHRLPLTK